MRQGRNDARRRPRALLASGVVLAGLLSVGAVTAGTSAGEDDRATPAHGGGSSARSAATVRTRSGTVRGRRLRLRKLRTPPRRPGREEAGEDEEVTRTPTKPNEKVDPPSGPPLPPDGTGAHAAATDFTQILRSSKVVKGGGRTSILAEPTATNDENANLVTGNDFAAISEANGLLVDNVWGRFLDVNALFPASLPGDGFCCDQVTATADRGSYSLTFLAAMSHNDGNQNTIQIAMFDGRDDQLRNENVGIADVCTFDFQPADFNLGSRKELDYIQMAVTDGALYLTSDVRGLKGEGKTPSYDGSVAWRMTLDEWESECSDAPGSNAFLGFSWFVADGGNNTLTPVINASSTMFLARHIDSATTTDKLRIWKWPDGGGLSQFDRDIANWPGLAGTQKCKIDGVDSDPCRRLDGRLRPGFRSGSTVGWVWTSSQGKGFKFPHVRAVSFDTGSLTKVMDKQIYSDDYAVTYPAVGVNAAGRLGVVYYRMGGSHEPEARAFITSTPRDWGVNPLTVVTSTNAPEADSKGDSQWGDYSSVRKYEGCPATFLAGVHSLQGGRGDSSVEVRSVWFGEPESGCPDYDVPDLTVVKNFSGTASAGDTFIVGVTTRNTGVVTPATDSRTAVYLSHDPEVDDFDLRLEPTDLVTPLAPGAEHFFNQQYAIPSNARGFYYVIACADDRTRIDDEVSETNNCAVSPDPTGSGALIEVEGQARDAELRDDISFTASPRNATLRMSVDGNGLSSKQLGGTKVKVDAAPTNGFRRAGIDVPVESVKIKKTSTIAGLTRLRQVREVRLRLPRRVRKGKYFVRVCLVAPKGVLDTRFGNDCRITRKAVTLRR